VVVESKSNEGLVDSLSLQLTMSDGTPVTLTINEMDIHNAKLPMTRKMREIGAISYGTLSFTGESSIPPKAPVVWAIVGQSLQLEPHDTEEHLMTPDLGVICKDAIFTLFRKVLSARRH
jgi:hypothetical protein